MEFKNTLIIGDSYSTFLGFIPRHNAAYYYDNPEPHGLSKVEQTWWHQLITETSSNLVLNDSWSGSCICHTGYDGEDCSETSSFVYRLEKYNSQGFFKENHIDTVFVFGGTNDSWSGAPRGELKFSDWTKEDLYKVQPATCYLINRLKEILPNAEIIWLINCDISETITEGVKKACEHYGIKYIHFENIDKIDGHPTPMGMTQIKEQIYGGLDK